MTTPYGPSPGGYPGGPQAGGYLSGPQAGIGRLVVDCSHSSGAFILSATGPKIEINGQPVNANWGSWPFDLPAGQYFVRVSTRYLGEMGPAQLSVMVYPGQVTTIFYRTPAAIGMAGAIGFVPQKTRGMAGLLVAMLVLFVFMLVVTLTL